MGFLAGEATQGELQGELCTSADASIAGRKTRVATGSWKSLKNISFFPGPGKVIRNKIVS